MRRYTGIKSIAINAGHLITANFSARLVRLLYVISLARVLGPDLFGLLVYCQFWHLLFFPVVTMGLGPIISKEIGLNRKKGQEIIAQTLSLRVVSSLCGAMACGLSGWFLNSDPLTQQLLVLFSIALAGRGIVTWGQEVYVAYEASRYVVQQEVFFRLIELGLGLSLLSMGGGIVEVVIIYTLVWWLQLIAGLLVVHRKFALLRFSWSWIQLKPLVLQGMTVLFFSVSAQWLLQGPLVMFRHIDPANPEIGQFALVMQVLMITSSIPKSIAMSSLPVLSRNVAENRKKTRQYAEGMLRIGLLSGAFLGFVGLGIGPPMVNILFGNPYHQAGDLLGLALWILIPYTLANLLSYILFAEGRYHKSSLCAVIGVVCFSLSFPGFVTTAGINGALISTGIGAGIWAIGVMIVAVPSQRINSGLAFFRPFCVVLLALAFYAQFDGKQNSLVLITSLLILLFGPFFFGIITPQERGTIRTVLRSIWLRLDK